MATRAVAGTRARARARPRPPAARTVLVRRRLIAAALALIALYAGYMLWFRNLSWFAVEDVTLAGATTNQQEIKAALERVAPDMTTLNLDDAKLRDAVSGFPTVASIRATTSFPHTLHVTITQRLPVAYLQSGGRRIAVSADGYLLPGASFDSKSLPRIQGAAASAPRLNGNGAAQAAILGATPPPLRDRINGSSWDDQRGGVVVDLRGGPEIRFGDGSRARDKWEAAVAVLSSPQHGSPAYLDVSVPDRPVAGG